MNHTDLCDVTTLAAGPRDGETGQPTGYVPAQVLANARCTFAVLGAAEHEQQFGSGTVDTDLVTASLQVPNAYGLQPTDSYKVTVHGVPGTWRVVNVRPGRDWQTWQLALNY